MAAFSKKTLTAAVAALIMAGSLAVTTTEASARGWRGGYGGAVAAGVIGGLAVGALAASAYRPVYAAPVYDDYAPDCYRVARRVWIPGYGWSLRRRTVCE